ncbi:MAG: glutathione S-transferase family protein [Gammaproteobacteria bacterium]|jgi:glutathione S-transferase
MYRVYGDLLSGNCYKIKLILEFLSLPYSWQHLDILAGETQVDTFLAINSNGKVPVLQISEGEFLSESNAILNFLAEGSDWLPDTGLLRARILQWQFFEQYSHEPYIAVARYLNRYLGLPDARLDEYRSKQQGGHKALAVMERQLKDSAYLVGDRPSIADISLYAYTHVAHEGGFDLSDYPAIKGWLDRFSNLPGYVAMPGQ